MQEYNPLINKVFFGELIRLPARQDLKLGNGK